MNSLILDQADKVFAANGKTFYWAKFLLSNHHANRATRLYYFCRYIDDIADESLNPEKSKLNLIKVYNDIAHGFSDDKIINDAIALFAECGIEKKVIFEFINGVSSDLALVRITDTDQLLKYCYRVAGTVGLMMCKVLDIKSEQAYQFAIDLGIAMQLTNISRDILEDAKLDRRYVPESMGGNFNPSKLDSESKVIDIQIRNSIKKLTTLANKYYKSGNNGLPYISFRARVGILFASKLYQEIGVKLAKSGDFGWRERVSISQYDKLRLSIYVLIKNIVSPLFWKNTKPHNFQLHQALQNLPYAHVHAI